MLNDFQQCSNQYLNQVFKPLDDLKDYVFWINNLHLRKIFYISSNYQSIWERDVDILYEAPMLWLSYLDKKDELIYAKQLQARYDQEFVDHEKNLALYKIITPMGKLRHLADRCYKCQDGNGQYYVAGIVRKIPIKLWQAHFKIRPAELDNKDTVAHNKFLTILQQEFGIIPINYNQQQLATFDDELYCPNEILSYKLSKRESESLYHICQGKSYKQTGREMAISHRTVETHLEHVRNKTSCNNKSELIGRFSRYFIDNINK